MCKPHHFEECEEVVCKAVGRAQGTHQGQQGPKHLQWLWKQLFHSRGQREKWARERGQLVKWLLREPKFPSSVSSMHIKTHTRRRTCNLRAGEVEAGESPDSLTRQLHLKEMSIQPAHTNTFPVSRKDIFFSHLHRFKTTLGLNKNRYAVLFT